MNRDRLRSLLAEEREAFAANHPRSKAAYQAARPHLLGGVPMTWMNLAAGGFPLYLDHARGARVTDLDGHEYVDFALGDTGAMAGHSPPATVEAIARQSANGITAMMPTEDAAWVGQELARRFGPPQWSFTLTATDANRWAIRLARQVTNRPKILVFAWCYHGSVDEAFALPGRTASRRRGPATSARRSPLAHTTRVVEYNDAEQLERALAHHDVAAVLMEPALTNIGIVLPEPGYLDAVRRLTREHGTLLINDETHTFSAGPGGATKAWDLEPDIVTIGKAIAGGVPSGAFGISDELAERIAGRARRRPRRHRRRRRHPGRQRALAGGHPRHARARPHRRGVRRHDATRDPLHRRRPGGHRRARARLVGRPDRRPRRVPLRLPAAAHGQRIGCRRRPASSRTSCTSTWPTAASSSRPSTTWR